MSLMTLKTSLLSHQIAAVKKLSKIKVGALYMEMGTGKTRTALDLIASRYNAGKVNHILWLCPFSVKKTIEREVIKHAGRIDNLTICGIETLSPSIRVKSELYQLVRDKNVFLIVDESNLVKNHKAERTKAVLYIAESCDYKLILNGTPLSRNEADLFSQWQILDWRILGYRSFWSFSSNHIEWDEKIRGKVKSTQNIDYLVRKIAPYTYQVKKDECLDLPSKSYSVAYCELTEEQSWHYHQAANELLFEVDELLPHTIYRMFTGLQNIISGLSIDTNSKGFNSKPLFSNPMDNPRMQLLMGIVHRLDDKIIIFCKNTHEINDIVSELNKEYGEGSAVPFNGEVSQSQRQLNLDAFATDSRFLVANKMTAGYGLNLQFCNRVIYYSNDWDFATRIQSEDRVHRFGQDKKVSIIDICAADTLDERILACLNNKEGLVEAFKDWISKHKDKKDLKAMQDWMENKERVEVNG